ncbi:hypothetical protein QYM36_009673 [Artemia franciscana]|uniref:Reverse transcriptase domain-containing protein n=1 Tax=Artemia franciscana TaxID=6661 RepID=A0AA88L5T4_ARTSF|nr:hypothetical protein QYM36_009673 [Artemia franciscana]
MESSRTLALTSSLGSLNLRAFWKKVASSKSAGPQKMTNRVGSATGPKDIAELWSGHYSVVFSSVASDPKAARARFFFKPWTDPVKQLITAESVALSLSGLSGSKSGGLDGVTANHIKYVPDSITEVCLVPIPKPNVDDMASLSNYRPIPLAVNITKLFEKCLYSLISPQIDSSHYRFGFKEGSSTEFCVFILKSVAQQFWLFSSHVFACFVDAKAAFDRVNLEKILDKIDTKGVDRRIIGTLQYWFEVERYKIKWSGYFSESFPVLNGVRQGGVL